jgi:hypothetical protein
MSSKKLDPITHMRTWALLFRSKSNHGKILDIPRITMSSREAFIFAQQLEEFIDTVEEKLKEKNGNKKTSN